MARVLAERRDLVTHDRPHLIKGKVTTATIVNRVERELIVQVMESCGGVQTKAATRLGINRNTLRSKLQQYNLEEPAGE